MYGLCKCIYIFSVSETYNFSGLLNGSLYLKTKKCLLRATELYTYTYLLFLDVQ